MQVWYLLWESLTVFCLPFSTRCCPLFEIVVVTCGVLVSRSVAAPRLVFEAGVTSSSTSIMPSIPGSSSRFRLGLEEHSLLPPPSELAAVGDASWW